jgi:hypothetical protein
LKAGNGFAKVVISDFTDDEAGTWVNLSTGALATSYTLGTWTVAARTTTAMGDGWHRITVTTTVDVTTTRAFVRLCNADNSDTATNGVSSAIVWGAQFNRGFGATAYIATTSAAKVGLPISYGEGLLVEPAATNIATYSNLQSDWGFEQLTFNGNTQVAPDGATEASTLTSDGSNNYHSSFLAGPGGATAAFTFSIFAKKGTHNFITISISDTGGTNYAAGTYDLNGGTVSQTDDPGTATGVVASITSIGNGWYRCEVTATVSYNFLVVSIPANGTPTLGGYGRETWDAAGTETVHVWGAQSEAGTVATSPIPTLGSTVTRADDDIRALTSTFTLGSAYSLIAQFLQYSLGEVNTAGPVVAINDDSPANRVDLRTGTLWNLYKSFIGSGGVAQAELDTGNVPDVGVVHKLGVAAAANDFALVQDGVAPSGTALDSSGSMPVAPTILKLGTIDGLVVPVRPLLIMQVTHIPRRLSNSELQAKTI